MISRTRRRAATFVGVAALVLASAAAGSSAASAAASGGTAMSSVAPAGGVRAAAAAPTGGWTAGGLISGVGAPRSAGPSLPTGFASVGGCVFYASSSSAGGYCPSGGVLGAPEQSLRAWLNGDEFDPCRFFELPEGMVINIEDQHGGHFMLKSCLKGYEFDQPWGGQHIWIDLYVQWVPNDRRHEVMELSDKMRQLWNVLSERNYYPLPRIGTGPSNMARVGSYQYFWATWVEALNTTKTTQPSFRIAYNTISAGTVYLHATISDLTIHPGVDGMDNIACGRADVPFDPDAKDTIPQSKGGSQPSDCWTVYTHSSASEDNETVWLDGTATWHVQVEAPNGTPLAQLGDFHYVVTQRQAVGEVEPLTDW